MPKKMSCSKCGSSNIRYRSSDQFKDYICNRCGQEWDDGGKGCLFFFFTAPFIVFFWLVAISIAIYGLILALCIGIVRTIIRNRKGKALPNGIEEHTGEVLPNRETEICPDCNDIIRPENRFCSNCGAERNVW